MRRHWNGLSWSALTAMLAFLLTACGNQSATTSPSDRSAPSATKAEASAKQLAPSADKADSQAAPADAAVAKGKLVFLKNGCNACHMAGASQLGPSLYGLYGSQVKLKDGSTVIADEAYLRESIVEPNKKIVAGYSPVMVAYKLPEEELNQLIAYIKSLKDQKPEGARH
ncbi:MAG: cytochrome c [Fimbriimonadales bacterium]|nr:cytochrome c [Fimbriimonadales bacterium]